MNERTNENMMEYGIIIIVMSVDGEGKNERKMATSPQETTTRGEISVSMNIQEVWLYQRAAKVLYCMRFILACVASPSN